MDKCEHLAALAPTALRWFCVTDAQARAHGYRATLLEGDCPPIRTPPSPSPLSRLVLITEGELMARDNDLAATVEGLVEAHGGHIDALTDLAADLATQARLPRCRIWEALAAYSAEAARRSLEGEPVAGAA